MVCVFYHNKEKSERVLFLQFHFCRQKHTYKVKIGEDSSTKDERERIYSSFKNSHLFLSNLFLEASKEESSPSWANAIPSSHNSKGASQLVLVVKNSPASAGEIRDAVSIPGSGRFPGRGHSNPLWYSCLENPMDKGAWEATVHRVAKSQIWLKWLSMHSAKKLRLLW